MKKVILASSSPRRQALLRQIGLSFEVVVPRLDEDAVWRQHWQGPQRITHTARQVALAKATAVRDRCTGDMIVGADTVVFHQGEVLGKPRDPEDACRMLRTLSGSTHEVVTGVAVVPSSGRPRSAAARTRVTFDVLSDAEIAGYVASGEPMDKAGAYGIQGLGTLLVRSIRGSYDNVVGLPLHLLYRLLRAYGVEVL